MIEVLVVPLDNGQHRVGLLIDGQMFTTFPSETKEEADALALKVKSTISTQVARIKAPHG